jgi:choline dehydrogenase-like flavoprotein
MRHLTGSVYSRFERPVRMWRGETMAGVIADESDHREDRDFVGGYYMETLSLGPAFLAAFIDPGAWGPDFTEAMDAYEHTAGIWLVGEDMPQPGNRVTLNPAMTDQHGLPVPDVHFDDHPNDVAMREHAWAAGAAVHEEVGGLGHVRTPPYPATHNLGTARMSDRPEDGVVNRWGQAHDVPNLFVADGSVMTTGAAANPTLTIVALAMRTGDHLGEQVRAGAL